jgi:hypothetical protein
VETQEQRKEEAGSRVSAFIAREGTHITLTAEAYKLHVQISVKDRADANKVTMVHQTASTNFGEMERHGVKDGEHTLAPTTQWCQSELGDCSSFNGA